MSAQRPEATALVLTTQALAVRSSLEPTAWVVLEELALRSNLIDGQAVAEQSVRTLAAAIDRSKDAVARSLRQLLDAGLVERAEERHDFSGRFTGMRYVVDLRAAGLRLPADPIASDPPATRPAHVAPSPLPPPPHLDPVPQPDTSLF